MSILRRLNDLEKWIDNSRSDLDDLRIAIEDDNQEYQNTINDLELQIDVYKEDQYEAGYQIAELRKDVLKLELELIETTNELITLRHELAISRKKL